MPSLRLNPALGRASTNFTIAGCTIASDGTITVGTAKPLTGQLNEWEPDGNNETENISPSTARAGNEVIIETMNSLRVAGFLLANDVFSASSTNPLWFITQTFDYVQCAGTWAGRSYSFIGVVKRYGEAMASKGKIGFTAEFGFPDIGAANPAWS